MQHSERKALELTEKVTKRIKSFFTWLNKTPIGNILKSTFQIVLYAVVFFFVFQFLTSLHIFNKDSSQDLASDDSSDSSSIEDENCNVRGINLHGMLVTYIPEDSGDGLFSDTDLSASESITWAINDANQDDKIKAILIEVDSGGGLPVAGEEVANAIKASKKPTVAFIRQTGASAAYWAISSADKIFASANSDVGSIGVTSSYLAETDKNKKEGYEYISLSSGKYKDTGNPEKPITQDDKDIIMRDLKIVFQNFIKVVSENRNIPIEKVEALADGSTVLGSQAKIDGLVDEIGGRPEAENYIEQQIDEEPQVCW